MYIERYVCGESSKLTIDVNSKSSFLNFIVANISDDAGKLKSTELPGTLTRYINGVPKIITFGGKRYECIKNHEGKIQAYD
jgi:hypothetical protein